MKRLNTIALIIFLGFSGQLITTQLIGQDSIPLPTQNVKVVKQFQPRATDAKAIEIFPKDLKATSLPELNMKYDIPAKEFIMEYPDPVIKPLIYEENKEIVDNKDGYIKAGYGNLQSPFVESQFHYDIQDWFQTGYSVKHFSAKDETPEIFRSFSQTDAGIYASYYLTDQTKVTADVFYKNEDRTIWGSGIKEFDLQPSTMLDKYGIGLRIDHNSFSVKGFSTKHNLGASRINSKFNEESEYNFSYSSTSNKTINKDFLFNLPMSFDYFTSDEWSEDPNQFTARPNVFYKKNNLSIRGGAFLATNDSLYVRPHVEASYQLTKYNLEVMISYVANSSANSLHKMYNEMPLYHNASDSIVNFTVHEKISLGAIYKTKKSSLYFGGFYSNFKDRPLYVYVQSGLNEKFVDSFDGFGLELKGQYQIIKKISIELDLELNSYYSEYDLVDNPVPTYIAPFLMNIKLVQKPVKGLTIYQSGEFSTGALVIAFEDEGILFPSLPGFVDLGAGIEYVFKNKFGLYFEAGNLLNKSYQRYWKAPSFGLNFNGGIKFLF